jgi:hypothetical protein
MTIRLLIILLGISYSSFAKEIEGYYITLQNDTVSATFNVKWFIRPSLYKLQNKAECIDKNGQKQQLTSQNTAAFTLFLPDGATTFRSIKWIEKEKQYEQFMIDLGGNYLKLYAYITLHSYDKSELYNHIFKKHDQETITEIPTINFRRDMIKYFEDYPDLAEKIQKKEYTRENLRQIVEMYNTYQSNKTKK